MRTDDEIVQMHRDRTNAMTAQKRISRSVREAYDGDLVVPVPGADMTEQATTANIVQMGIDQTARRVSSTPPTPMFLADGEGKTARDRARDRRNIVKGWWDLERLALKLPVLTRHWCAYSAAILTVTPNADYSRACWRVRDPLDSFPCDVSMDETSIPDCIFETKRTLGWLRREYPMAAWPSQRDANDEKQMTILEYLDQEERVMVACWQEGTTVRGYTNRSARLSRAPIELDVAPTVMAQRPGLNRPVGQMDNVIGPYWAMNMLHSLELLAVKASVYANTWMIGKDGIQPKIIRQANGLEGVTGIATDGTPWIENPQPGYAARPAIEGYERDMRVTAQIPAEFGGESGSNIRTGRRGDSVLSAAVDFAVAEAQNMIAAMLHDADMAAIDYDRKWYGRPKVFYFRQGDREIEKNYTAGDLWKRDRHEVQYAFAGQDMAGQIVSLGQRLGMEIISKRRVMLLDPMNDDAEAEHDQIEVEALERALLQGLTQQAASGAIPPADIAAIMKLIRTDVDLADAVQQVHDEMQKRQAQQAPPSSPAAQPGMAQPGAGAEAASIAPPTQTGRNLTSMFAQLGLQQRAAAQAQPQPAPA